MKNVALILAGGLGSRMGTPIPKQYMPIPPNDSADTTGERTPMLRRSIDIFLRHPMIDAVCVVMAPGSSELYHSATKGLKLLPPVLGGDTRQASAFNGLHSLQAIAPHNVLIHDAARPFVTTEVIDHVLQGLSESEAVDLAIPVVDTIKSSMQGVQLLDRQHLYSSQTPQGFRYNTIWHLHQQYQSHKQATDDISLCVMAGIPIKIVDGSCINIKITTMHDYMQCGGFAITPPRIGIGYDIHRFDTTKPSTHIMLGGAAIPCKHPLIAHSDGDVILHALTDAILGTIGAGDIGTHFSPSDPLWENAASHLFVERALELLTQHNGKINNVDVVVITEFPKLSPHHEAIHSSLKKMLALPTAAINIKAKTAEGLDAIGQGQAIAAYVVCSTVFK